MGVSLLPACFFYTEFAGHFEQKKDNQSRQRKLRNENSVESTTNREVNMGRGDSNDYELRRRRAASTVALTKRGWAPGGYSNGCRKGEARSYPKLHNDFRGDIDVTVRGSRMGTHLVRGICQGLGGWAVQAWQTDTETSREAVNTMSDTQVDLGIDSQVTRERDVLLAGHELNG
jgi:hypothetical protein